MRKSEKEKERRGLILFFALIIVIGTVLFAFQNIVYAFIIVLIFGLPITVVLAFIHNIVGDLLGKK